MAVPPEKTTLDFTGRYLLNKSLSDPYDTIFSAQGMGWVMRKTIGLATITLHVKHYKDSDGVEHIDIDQYLNGGIKGSSEMRTLNWTERRSEDKAYGFIVGKSRRVTDLSVVEPDDEWLKSGWTPDTLEHGFVQGWAESDTPKSNKVWRAVQLWGFEEINGERRYVRHIHFTGPDSKTIKARLVYDFTGPLQG